MGVEGLRVQGPRRVSAVLSSAEGCCHEFGDIAARASHQHVHNPTCSSSWHRSKNLHSKLYQPNHTTKHGTDSPPVTSTCFLFVTYLGLWRHSWTSKPLQLEDVRPHRL